MMKFLQLVCLGQILLSMTGSAFTLSSSPSSSHVSTRGTVSTTELGLFEGLFGGEGKAKASSPAAATGGGTATGGGPATLVVDLPANAVKVAPLSFFLKIYLVSEQNNPVQGSWLLNNNDENQSFDMYYKDGTGMFSMTVQENGIQINRYGTRPSLEYMLQESVMLHGVLDELYQIAFEVNDIEAEKRLLQFDDATVLDAARKSLPARQEKS